MKRLAIFTLLFFLFGSSVIYYLEQSNPLKSAAHGYYDPSIMLDFEIRNIELINETHGYVKASGFNNFIITNSDTYYPRFHTVELTDNLLVTSSSLPTVQSKHHTIELYGFFDHDGVFHLVEYRIIKWHIFKYILSFIAFLWFLGIFFREWRITRWGFRSA